MKMKLIDLVAVVLAGCATAENYERKLASWVGASETDLIRAWGAPQQAFDSGSSRFLTFSSHRNVFLPGTAPTVQTTFSGNTAYTNQYGGSPAMNIGMSCVTTFEVMNGRVVSWRYQGNDCKST